MVDSECAIALGLRECPLLEHMGVVGESESIDMGN